MVLVPPLNIFIQPSTNAGVAVAMLRQDEGLDEAEAHDEHQPEAQQDIADQSEPAGLHGLPGIDSRQAEQPEEAHGAGDHVNRAQRVVVTDAGTFAGWKIPTST